MCEQSPSSKGAIQLTAANAVEYLRSRGYLGPREWAFARELAGGVSNLVIHVARENGDELVLKQVGVAGVYTPKDFKITGIMSDVVKLVAART